MNKALEGVIKERLKKIRRYDKLVAFHNLVLNALRQEKKGWGNRRKLIESLKGLLKNWDKKLKEWEKELHEIEDKIEHAKET